MIRLKTTGLWFALTFTLITAVKLANAARAGASADIQYDCTPTVCTLRAMTTVSGETLVRWRWVRLHRVTNAVLATIGTTPQVSLAVRGPDTLRVRLYGYHADSSQTYRTKDIVVPAAAPVIDSVAAKSIAGLPPFNGAIPRDTIVFNGNAVFVYKLLGFVNQVGSEWAAARYVYPTQDSAGVWITAPMQRDSIRYPTPEAAKRALSQVMP